MFRYEVGAADWNFARFVKGISINDGRLDRGGMVGYMAGIGVLEDVGQWLEARNGMVWERIMTGKSLVIESSDGKSADTAK